MKIGIFISAKSTSGGAFQYQSTFLEVIRTIKNDYDFVIITTNPELTKNIEKEFKILDITILWKFLSAVNLFIKIIDKNEIVFHSILHYKLKKEGIDLMTYTSPQSSSFKLNIPYIFTVYDLQHRLHPEFPEVSSHGLFEFREYIYKNALSKAIAVIAESQTGKEDIINLYGIDKKKIFVLKFLPPPHIKNIIDPSLTSKIKRKYHLPDNFIFYPANFWPHKNHKLILKALSILKEKSIIIHCVFTGSTIQEWGEFNKIIELSRTLNLETQIHYLGHVNDDEIPVLYQLSSALVMPTYFGPSNIPYLEAFSLGVPVITSQVRGIIEQVGDAAILVNPDSPDDLADAIAMVMNNKEIREKLIKNGYLVIESWTIPDFIKELKNIYHFCEKQLNSF